MDMEVYRQEAAEEDVHVIKTGPLMSWSLDGVEERGNDCPVEVSSILMKSG